MSTIKLLWMPRLPQSHQEGSSDQKEEISSANIPGLAPAKAVHKRIWLRPPFLLQALSITCWLYLFPLNYLPETPDQINTNCLRFLEFQKSYFRATLNTVLKWLQERRKMFLTIQIISIYCRDIWLSDTISSLSACICKEATNVQIDLTPLRADNISFLHDKNPVAVLI